MTTTPEEDEYWDQYFGTGVPMADKGKYGSIYPESEVVLGSITQDVEYVESTLREMSSNELTSFLKTLKAVYDMTTTILIEKDGQNEEIMQLLSTELDRILEVTS